MCVRVRVRVCWGGVLSPVATGLDQREPESQGRPYTQAGHSISGHGPVMSPRGLCPVSGLQQGTRLVLNPAERRAGGTSTGDSDRFDGNEQRGDVNQRLTGPAGLGWKLPAYQEAPKVAHWGQKKQKQWGEATRARCRAPESESRTQEGLRPPICCSSPHSTPPLQLSAPGGD